MNLAKYSFFLIFSRLLIAFVFAKMKILKYSDVTRYNTNKTKKKNVANNEHTYNAPLYVKRILCPQLDKNYHYNN